MSRHLSPEEFVDAIDDVLPAARRDHIDQCAECRSEIDALRAVITDAQPAAHVPPPSPLFLDHLVGRVQVAADLEEPRDHRSWWGVGWAAAAAAAVLAALVAAPFLFRTISPDVPALSQTAVAPAPTAIPVPPADAVSSMGAVGALEGQPEESSPAAKRSWTRVVTAGRGVSADAVMAVAPSTPATAVLIEDLTPRELQEFARLLRAQMGGVQ